MQNLSFQGLDVLILGDVILDHYLIGEVDRISPEAPVPVIVHRAEDYRLGGAANVALNVQALGATPHLISVIGQDYNGSIFKKCLKKAKISHHDILSDSDRPTTIKTRVLARNQQLFRYDKEKRTPLPISLIDSLKSKIRQKLDHSPIKVIIFQDYDKGVLSADLIQHTIKEANKRGIVTVADPKRVNFLNYAGVTLFKPNLKEINEGLDLRIHATEPNWEQLATATKQLQAQLDCKYVLVTLSAKGMFLSASTYHTHFPTKERQVADVCGAGDTVISVIALGLAADLSIEACATMANLAGGQVCEKIGVVPVNKEQLLEEYRHYAKNNAQKKLTD